MNLPIIQYGLPLLQQFILLWHCTTPHYNYLTQSFTIISLSSTIPIVSKRKSIITSPSTITRTTCSNYLLSSSSSKSSNNNNNVNEKNDNSDNNDTNIISKEAQELLTKAKLLRDSINEVESKTKDTATTTTTTTTRTIPKSNSSKVSKFNVNVNHDDNNNNSIGYRLYVDIGREDGTWMDPRWGRSGKRIEFTIDISFLISPPPRTNNNDNNNNDNDNVIDSSLANNDIIQNMVKDNLSGKSSSVRIIQSALYARLRKGFDQMNVYGGGYRIDIGDNNRGNSFKKQISSSNTLRFYLHTDGTEEKSNYGDIYIPKGNLYFSIPCFGNDVRQLSSKEGIVTVRQIGWHTGWRREESRIVGVFRAVPIDQAQKRDGF